MLSERFDCSIDRLKRYLRYVSKTSKNSDVLIGLQGLSGRERRRMIGWEFVTQQVTERRPSLALNVPREDGSRMSFRIR